MSDFTFDEKTHRYYLEVDGVKKAMTGVTTVFGVIAKHNLTGWAANCAVDYIEEQIKKEQVDEEGNLLPEVFTQARTAYTRIRDDAASKGTDVHALCELYIKDKIRAGHSFHTDEPQVLHFIDWAEKNQVTFFASEKKVYDPVSFVAGTLDFACTVDGLKYIGDIKTSSGIYDRTPFAQCAAYQYLWAAMDGVKPEQVADRRLIINLKKTGVFDEDKDVYISEHYEDDIELFMSALTMYRNVGRFEPLHYLAKRK